jgi:hypothetical protein
VLAGVVAGAAVSAQLLVTVDDQKRVLLGDLATHEHYIAETARDGTIRLTPAVFVPASQARGGYEPAVQAGDAEAEAAYMRAVEAQGDHVPADHVPAPAAGQPLFDRHGREIPGDAFPWPSDWTPVTTQCRCGQQVARTGNTSRWEHFE